MPNFRIHEFREFISCYSHYELENPSLVDLGRPLSHIRLLQDRCFFTTYSGPHAPLHSSPEGLPHPRWDEAVTHCSSLSIPRPALQALQPLSSINKDLSSFHQTSPSLSADSCTKSLSRFSWDKRRNSEEKSLLYPLINKRSKFSSPFSQLLFT